MYLKHCEVESRIEFFKGDIQEIIKSKKTMTGEIFHIRTE